MFKVTGKGRSLMELRSILDWEIARKRSTPGIVEVNSHGGELKTYEVTVDNAKLMATTYARPGSGGVGTKQRQRWRRLPGRSAAISSGGP